MMYRTGSLALLLAVAVGLSGCAGALRWNTPRHKPVSANTHTRSPQTRATGADEYEVQPGDTVYSIAFRNQLDFHELARWNGIGSDYRIVPGRVLRLKPPRSSTAARPSQAPEPVPVPSVAAAVPAVKTPAMSHHVEALSPNAATMPQPAKSAAANFEWAWPLNGPVARNYAPSDGNKGLDFTGTLGMPVLAAAPGRVVYSGNALKGYGELIIIKHDETFLSAYAYNRRRLVNEGDVVTTGQPIAELGLGPQSKPLLHFEIRVRGQPVNPLDYLPKQDQPLGVR
ncbi:MAG: peptidoglycan DD-metalloendopeptidase family protein [Stenotrophobium sp.]